jgi:hypothetical protein
MKEVKIFVTNERFVKWNSCSTWGGDYIYQIWEDGFLMHSVTVKGIRTEAAKFMFPGFDFLSI